MMRRSMMQLSTCAALALVLFTGSMYADANPPAGVLAKYIMVLREPGDPGRPGGNPGKPGASEEPDVTKHGGKLVRSIGTWRVVYLPLPAAKHFREHPRVAVMQRVWEGESLEGWTEGGETDESLTNVTTQAADTNLSWGPKAYQYDGAGNITAAGSDTYTYDGVDRLKSATVGEKTQTFQYDAFGNLTRIDTTGAPARLLPVDPASNRLTNATYDAAGNVVAATDALASRPPRYEYDSLGMLVNSDNNYMQKRMIYTADDERIAVQSEATNYLWTIRDFEGSPLRQFRGSLQYEWLWEEDFIYAGGDLVGAQRGGQSMASYGWRLHYHRDHLGSVRLITTDDRLATGVHDYFPFGVEKSVSVQEELNFSARNPALPDPLKFTGQERDFNGWLNVESTDYLDYMHARFYDPNWGRFLSVDPTIAVQRSMHNPQGWNRYAYARDNPLLRVDPDGRKDKVFVVAALEAKYTMPMQKMLNAELKGTPYAGRVEMIGPSASRGQMLATLRNADSSDIVIIAGHAGRSPDAARGGNVGTLFNGQGQITSGATMAQWANDGSAPKAVIVAGCCSNQVAQTITNTAGSETLGTNQRTINGENQPGAVAATGVLARGGTIQDAAAAANQHIKTDGDCGRNTGCDPSQPARFEANPPR